VIIRDVGLISFDAAAKKPFAEVNYWGKVCNLVDTFVIWIFV